MNLAVIGSGGREHAICYKLKQSPKIKRLICIPGNAGTKKIAKNIKEDISNFDAIYEVIKDENIDELISNHKPPIFWKDKEIVKNQIVIWKLKDTEKFVKEINDTELIVKKNYSNSVNVVSDFIINSAK